MSFSRLQRSIRFHVSRRFRVWIFSLLFGLIVVGNFFALRYMVPEAHPNHQEIVTILFLVISVLILFPARDKIARWLLNKGDYSFLLGKDDHHLDFIARQFSMDALIQEIVPELLDWLGVQTGRIAILEHNRQSFQTHTIKKGKTYHDRPIPHEEVADIEAYLIRRNGLIYIYHLDIPEEVREFMKNQSALVLQPFVYRNRFLGFLMLKQDPRNRYAAIGLDTFAGKAAVGIQNYILSMRVVGSRLLEQEIEAAEKIQNLLQTGRIPHFAMLDIRTLKTADSSSIIEFIHCDDGKWIMAILCAPRLTGAAGILLFGVLGYLYSFTHRGENITLQRLMTHLEREPALTRSEYKIEFLLGEICPEEPALAVLAAGDNLNVIDTAGTGENLVTEGKRVFLDFPRDRILQISYANEPLIEFEPRISTESPEIKSVGILTNRPKSGRNER